MEVRKSGICFDAKPAPVVRKLESHDSVGAKIIGENVALIFIRNICAVEELLPGEIRAAGDQAAHHILNARG